jgi:vacuolar-type H+-ATPase subunit E/Vma4
MEELQTTEVLDREILEEARRKAQKILRAADETAAAGTKRWDRKTDRAVTGIKTHCAERLEASRTEIMARLPLDKRRSRLEKIEGLLRAAASSYLAALPRKKLLALLETELKKRAGELQMDEAKLQVRVRGLSGAELQGLFQAAFPGGQWQIREGDLHTVPGTAPAVVADTPKARITASADAAVEALLRDKRAELASALLGEGALDA